MSTGRRPDDAIHLILEGGEPRDAALREADGPTGVEEECRGDGPVPFGVKGAQHRARRVGRGEQAAARHSAALLEDTRRGPGLGRLVEGHRDDIEPR